MNDFTPFQIKHYLVFNVANEKFALDIRDIESVHVSSSMGKFDDVEDLKTAVRLHKRVVPIINMRKKLRLRGENPIQPSLLFIRHTDDSNSSLIGLQVDQTLEIVEVAVQKRPNGKSPRLIKVMIGMQQELIMVLRTKDILNTDELIYVEPEMLN